jgi:hypothetical protein
MLQQEKTCEFCGGTFTPERSTRKYCSPTCNQYAYLKRKEESVVQETTTVQKVYKTPEPEKTEPENKTDDAIKVESIQPVQVPTATEKKETAEGKKKVQEKVPSINSQIAVDPPPKELTFDEKLQKRIKTCIELWEFCQDMGRWNQVQWDASETMNEEIRIIIEELLMLASKKSIHISQLKELVKFLGDLHKSKTFKELHGFYPHYQFIPIVKTQLEDFIALHEAKFEYKVEIGYEGDFEILLLSTLYVIKDQQKRKFKGG